MQTHLSIHSDEELMVFICQGNALAYEELYYRYSKQLLSYFFKMLNNDKNLAEDALQDLFLKIAEYPEKFDNTKKFKTWVYTVATNVCKNFYRHQTVVNKANEEFAYFGKTDELTETPIFNIDRTAFNTELNKLLNELSFEKKEAFLLRYIEDKMISEIALIQNCSEGTVKSRIHYTLKTLQEQLIAFK